MNPTIIPPSGAVTVRFILEISDANLDAIIVEGRNYRMEIQ